MTAMPAAMCLSSAAIRRERAGVRRALRAGDVSLEDTLTTNSPFLAGVLLFELISWRRGWGKSRMQAVGAAAMRDHINLAIQFGEASTRTIDWLIAADRSMGHYTRKQVAERWRKPVVL